MSHPRLVVITITAVAQACATAGHKPGPFAVEPVEVAERMDVVAVAPVAVSAGVTIADSTLSSIDSLVVQELRGGGIIVVDPAAYERLWAQVYQSAGPIFDQHTGERDEAAYQAAWASFYEKLAAQYQANVVLFPEIWEVDAEVQNGYAKWDGASQNMASTGSHVLAILDVIFPTEDGTDYGFLPNGYVEALSLNVALEDATGDALYTHRAGIESLRKRISSDRLPDSGVLQDWARIEEAVRHALAPILDAYREKGINAETTDKTIATPNR